VGINYRGVYDGGAVYANNDVVTFQGSTYIMRYQNLGQGYDPVGYASMWGLLAEVGAKGEPGEQGPQGQQGTQGTQGIQGAAGQGIAAGGTQGQVIVKSSSNNYETTWSSLKTINGTSIAGTGDITVTSGVTTGKAIAMAIVFG
jgi:hypothetical protein